MNTKMQPNTCEGIVFIYEKEGKIKALSFSEAINESDKLKNEKWIHKHTINACMFIENLHNNCQEDSLINEVKALGV